jgi:beta-glucosidase/6-phospho-beta-glucosidase/beta-galactosidase
MGILWTSVVHLYLAPSIGTLIQEILRAFSFFSQSHMSEMLKAIYEDGCSVIAYTFWSLLDSFEWDLGYT